MFFLLILSTSVAIEYIDHVYLYNVMDPIFMFSFVLKYVTMVHTHIMVIIFLLIVNTIMFDLLSRCSLSFFYFFTLLLYLSPDATLSAPMCAIGSDCLSRMKDR